MFYELPATASSCQWGWFRTEGEPCLTVESQDVVRIQCVSHRAGDAPDYLMDEPVQKLYQALWPGRGPGPHIVTGPVAVRGAEPGDLLEVRFLEAELRLPYGSNMLAPWGVLYSAPVEGQPASALANRAQVVVYRIFWDRGLAVPLFEYPYPYQPHDPEFGGVIAPQAVTRQPIHGSMAVPLRPHPGISGVSLAPGERWSTREPGVFGGNVDNRSFVPGTRMFYPVLRPGAWYWVGDTHLAQGDGEISGTAIEGHLTVTMRFCLHKQSELKTPVLDTPTAVMVHGFDRDLDRALVQAADNAVHFLVQRYRLTPTMAYSLLSVAGDVRVTQAVNTVKGVQIVIPKIALGAGDGGVSRDQP